MFSVYLRTERQLTVLPDAAARMDRSAPRPAAHPDASDRHCDVAGTGERGGGRVYEDIGDIMMELYCTGCRVVALWFGV